MRALIIALVIAASGVAHADGIDLVPKLGFRIGYGPLPLDSRPVTTTSLGLGVEHPLAGNARIFGEWEWLWFSERDPETAMATGRAMTHGTGQRLSAGLRHALVVSHGDSEMRWYLDGELGGGAMLASEDTLGTHATADGIVGLRFGLDFRNGDSSSRVFETEIMTRAIIVPTGYGVMFGVGMLWGD